MGTLKSSLNQLSVGPRGPGLWQIEVPKVGILGVVSCFACSKYFQNKTVLVCKTCTGLTSSSLTVEVQDAPLKFSFQALARA